MSNDKYTWRLLHIKRLVKNQWQRSCFISEYKAYLCCWWKNNQYTKEMCFFMPEKWVWKTAFGILFLSILIEYYKSSQRQREIYACLTIEQCGNFLGWLAYVYFWNLFIDRYNKFLFMSQQCFLNKPVKNCCI